MNIQALMQQANKMKREMEKKQAEIEATVFVSEAGGGAIKVEMKIDQALSAITAGFNMPGF